MATVDCHYCGTPGANTELGRLTDDHVVPKSLVRALSEVQKRSLEALGGNRTVKACRPCNHGKANRRARCSCLTCSFAWSNFEIASGRAVEVTWELPERLVA